MQLYSVARHKALAKIDDTVLPACWDRNTSVNAMSDCQSYDGLRKPHCIAIAYTITNYVVQCGRHFIFDNHCGIFMELHKAGDDTILSQTRMLGEYPSGYRTTTLPLYYKDRKRIVCRGNYEVRIESTVFIKINKSFRYGGCNAPSTILLFSTLSHFTSRLQFVILIQSPTYMQTITFYYPNY